MSFLHFSSWMSSNNAGFGKFMNCPTSEEIGQNQAQKHRWLISVRITMPRNSRIVGNILSLSLFLRIVRDFVRIQENWHRHSPLAFTLK